MAPSGSASKSWRGCELWFRGGLFAFLRLRPGRRTPNRRRASKQPLSHLICNRPQPLVTDGLAVNATHVRDLVAHDEVHGRLILRLVGDGPERVPERVEAEPFPAIDVEGCEELPRLLADRTRRRVLGPRQPALRDEH